MTSPPEILDLITRFERNISSYRSPAYNEAQLRLEFLRIFEPPRNAHKRRFLCHSEHERRISLYPLIFFSSHSFALMAALHKKLHSANTPSEKEMLQRQIDATDQQIDKLVYDLYGLTNEEITIVGEATAKRK